MAKQTVELNWVAVQADKVPVSVKKDYDQMIAMRDKVKEGIIAFARKQGALNQDETLAIAFKPWGFSMAKTAAKGAGKASNGADVFAAL